MLVTAVLFAALTLASPSPYGQHTRLLNRRQATFNESNPEVDLGYSVYRGTYNASAQLNIFRGCADA
jgi:hypothetical protein